MVDSNENEKLKMKNNNLKVWFYIFNFAWLLFYAPVWGAATTSAPSSGSEAYTHYLQGMVAERAGNTAKALEAYQHVVALDPQALEVYRDLASLQLRLGHNEEALEAAEKVRDLAPKDPASFIFLGNVHVAQGDLAKAADAYQEALNLDPNNLNALENLGNYYAIVDPQKAVSFYEHYLILSPAAGDVMMQLGLVQQKLGHNEKAIAYFDSAIKSDARQSAPHLAKADIYEQQKSTAAAIAAYQQALELQPKNPLILMHIGHLYYNMGAWDDADREFQAAHDLAPQDPTIYYWIARVAEEQKKWSKASEAAQQAYQYSQDPQFLPLAAYYMTLDHNLIKAVTWLERARKADPTNANTLLFLGMNNLELGRPKVAREALEQGVKLYPQDPQMHFQLGVAYDKLGSSEAAEKEFKTVLTLDPKNAGAMNYLGYTWTEKNTRLDEAEKLLRQAVQLDPDNAAFLDSLGWLRFKQQDLNEAQHLLEKAISIDRDALIMSHLAEVHAARKNGEMAMRLLAQAASLDPKDDMVRQRLNQVSAIVLPGLDPKKLLSYVEGNDRQIVNAVGDVKLALHWIGKPVPAEGHFYYVRPDQATLDLSSIGKKGPVRFRLQGATLDIEPEEARAEFKSMSAENLTDIPQFFSGAIALAFEGPFVKSDRAAAVFHFQRDSQEVWIDGRRGVITRYKRPAAGGGFNDMEITDYEFNEGLWVPTQIRLRNTNSGWTAHLTFSNWILNSALPSSAP